nr:hypothetical protein CFP56_33478 [Quercus suber]
MDVDHVFGALCRGAPGVLGYATMVCGLAKGQLPESAVSVAVSTSLQNRLEGHCSVSTSGASPLPLMDALSRYRQQTPRDQWSAVRTSRHALASVL